MPVMAPAGFDMAIWGDYFRRGEYYRRHLARYKRYVKTHGLICQACGGAGGETDVILDDGTGPWEACGWCEGTGYVTRWIRGDWLRWMAQEKARRAELQKMREAKRAKRNDPESLRGSACRLNTASGNG